MKDTEEPAFPSVVPKEWERVNFGMTLRDYFAAAALQGILAGKASNETFWEDDWCFVLPKTPEMTAAQAYERADAMLAERKK